MNAKEFLKTVKIGQERNIAPHLTARAHRWEVCHIVNNDATLSMSQQSIVSAMLEKITEEHTNRKGVPDTTSTASLKDYIFLAGFINTCKGDD